MISKFSIGNFKAFSETQDVPIRPITLIFGPNSSGKSSFIHSLLLASESFTDEEDAPFLPDQENKLDMARTEAGGSVVDLGGFRQYVHQQNLESRVEWGVSIRVEELLNSEAREFFSPIKEISYRVAFGLSPLGSATPHTSESDRYVHIQSLSIELDGAEVLRAGATSGNTLQVSVFDYDHPWVAQQLAEVVTAFSTTLEVTKEDWIEIKAEIDEMLLSATGSIGATLFPESLYVVESDPFSKEDLFIPVSQSDRAEDIRKAIRHFFPKLLQKLYVEPREFTEHGMTDLIYLGPLRKMPPRHTAFGENGKDGFELADGSAAVSMLIKDEKLRDRVNAWLNRDCISSPYEFSVSHLVPLELAKPHIARALEGVDIDITERSEDSREGLIRRLAGEEEAGLDSADENLIRRLVDQKADEWVTSATGYMLYLSKLLPARFLLESMPTDPEGLLESMDACQRHFENTRLADTDETAVWQFNALSGSPIDDLKQYVKAFIKFYSAFVDIEDTEDYELSKIGLGYLAGFDARLRMLCWDEAARWRDTLKILLEGIESGQSRDWASSLLLGEEWKTEEISQALLDRLKDVDLTDYENVLHDQIEECSTELNSVRDYEAYGPSHLKELDLSEDLGLQRDTKGVIYEVDSEATRVVDQVLRSGVRAEPELTIEDKRTNASVSLRDVGVGISQVLPVLAYCLNYQKRFIVMEEPESNLHPGLQAELGDLFIESALGNNKNTMIVETHSEHVILRLLRRIRETTDGDLPDGKLPLRPDDISVVYAEATDEGTIMHHLEVTEDGNFVRDWPRGFFEERIREVE